MSERRTGTREHECFCRKQTHYRQTAAKVQKHTLALSCLKEARTTKRKKINQTWDWFGGRSAVVSTMSGQSPKHIAEHCNITTLKSHSIERFVWCYWHVCEDAAVITWTNICSLLCLIKKKRMKRTLFLWTWNRFWYLPYCNMSSNHHQNHALHFLWLAAIKAKTKNKKQKPKQNIDSVAFKTDPFFVLRHQLGNNKRLDHNSEPRSE